VRPVVRWKVPRRRFVANDARRRLCRWRERVQTGDPWLLRSIAQLAASRGGLILFGSGMWLLGNHHGHTFFPSGIAAAETLRALHSKSSQSLRAAKALGLAAVIATIDKVWAKACRRSARGSNAFQAIRFGRTCRSGPGQSLRSLSGPDCGLFLGFHISRRRRHHRQSARAYSSRARCVGPW
jgi:hypothetical protein